MPCPYRDDMLIDFRRTPRRAVSCAAIVCRSTFRGHGSAVSLLARAEGGHGSAVSLLRLCVATFGGHRDVPFLALRLCVATFGGHGSAVSLLARVCRHSLKFGRWKPKSCTAMSVTT